MIDTTLALAFNLPTLIILLALALLIFGNRLPTIGRDLGKSIKGFKKGLSETEADEEDDDDDDIEEPVKKKKKPKQLDSDETETQSVRKREKVAQAEEED